jgi:anti-sigma regulatory factor (Ser/Thr protein kinase)
MSPETVRHSVLIPAETSRLAELRNSLSELFAPFVLPAKVTRRVILAIDEAVANIMEHGRLPRGGDEIEVSIEVADDRIVADILDNGIPFDPTLSGKTPNRDSYPRRGFGLYLIHMVADEVVYRRTDEGRNRLTLTKYLDPSREYDE